MSNPEKKSFKVPHQLVILFAIAVLATIATYVVPAGTYNTVTVNGRKMIDATTFHYIAQTPVSPWDAFLALPGGFTFLEDRDNFDYVYSMDAMTTLAGKKLHGKRNFCNRRWGNFCL